MRLEAYPENQPVNLLEPAPFTPEEKPPKKNRRFLLFTVILVLLILSANCVYREVSSNGWPSDPLAYDPVTLQPKKVGLLQAVKNFIFHSDNLLAGQTEDRVNILLLGMGGYGHDGPYLTDTNIIVSIKPNAKQVAMISVPRDLGVVIYEHGLKKINYANSFGEVANPGQGGEYARKLFADIFKLDIPYYIRVDFKAFAELIDTVGGINVTVPRAFTDNLYPGPNDSYQTISFATGAQTMNGDTALKYARSRHGNNGEGSDFARARRQQLILLALKDKLLSFGTYSNPVKIQKIMDSLSTHVTTNLDFGQLMYLARLARNFNGDLKSLVLDNSENGFLTSVNTAENGFLLIPKSGHFENINLAIKNIFETSQTSATLLTGPEIPASVPLATSTDNVISFSSAKIEIQNGTWRVGLASRLQKKLEENGFSVFSTSNAYKRPIAETGIYLINSNVPEEIQANLKNILGIRPASALPDWLKDDYDDPSTPAVETGVKYKMGSDILIVLGEDYKE